MADRLRPGDKAPKSGQYEERGPRGGKVSNTEITSTHKNTLPPTSKSGNTWQLVDETKHKK